jgi:DNA invertase Pin-like site-specific DNA recombinase
VRIATYTRISTDEVNQPYSLGAQSERLASYVASQEDWEMVGTFTDQMSGAKLERPGLTNALRAAKAGRFDLLLVYRVDRLSRSVRGLAEVLETLDAAGVGFRSATEPFDTTSAAGRMMVQMLGVFAEFERNADVGISLVLLSVREGVLDVALIHSDPRRRRVLLSVYDVGPTVRTTLSSQPSASPIT